MSLVSSILDSFGKGRPAPRLLPIDATLLSGKPALVPGMDNTLLLPSGSFAFWACNPRLKALGTVDDLWTAPAKLEMVTRAAWAAGYTKFCMDDEDQDFLRIRRNIAVIRKAAPGMKIGVFCFPQTYFNWSPAFMRTVDNGAQIKAILNASDFGVPGIDLRWDMSTVQGRKSWLAFLKLAVAESDRVMPGKPCYPFLPFEYNPVLKTGDLTDAELTWQLKQVMALGRQPILWGGWTRQWTGSLASRMFGRAA